MGSLGTSPIEVGKTLGRKSCLSQNFLSSLPILSRTLKPALHRLFLTSAVYTATHSSSDFSRQVCLPPVISKCSKQASHHTLYHLSETLLRALISSSHHLDSWPKTRSSLWGIPFLPFTKVSPATEMPATWGLKLSFAFVWLVVTTVSTGRVLTLLSSPPPMGSVSICSDPSPMPWVPMLPSLFLCFTLEGILIPC